MGEGLFQPAHLVLILGLALLVLGPGKLSEVGSELGKSVREFRRASSGVSESISPAPIRSCPGCGREVDATSRFCPSCGVSLSQ